MVLDFRWLSLLLVDFRWLQFNLDILAAAVVLSASLFAVLSADSDSGDAGLSVSYALQVLRARTDNATPLNALSRHASVHSLFASGRHFYNVDSQEL